MGNGDWREVTKAQPCPACGKPDWCAWSPDGWLKCERTALPPQGYEFVSEKANGAVFKPRGHATTVQCGSRRIGPGAVKGGRVCASMTELVNELAQKLGPAVGSWDYLSSDSQPYMKIVRFSPRSQKQKAGKASKKFRPIARVPGGWRIGDPPGSLYLYRLPDVLALPFPSRVYVLEGERKTDVAHECGLVATTSAHGCGSAAKSDWSPLEGHDVVIVPDNDPGGAQYADEVARLVTAAQAKSVKIVHLADLWSDLPKGGDIVDLLEHRQGNLESVRAEIEALVEKTAQLTPIELAPIDGAPVIVRLSDVKPEPVAWLWPGRIALGKLTLIAGDPGLGKSFLTLDMAARVSRGRAWPDAPGVATTPGGVVLLSAEDGVADTIRPRLDAAGADAARIVALEAIRSVGGNGRESTRTFDLSRDLTALEAAIRSVEDCRLVVIDPVTAYLGGVDSHKNADVRGLLAPLGAIAERHRVAVVAVTHLNKSGGGPAIYRAMGSLAFAAAARAAWIVSKDSDSPRRRLFLPIKNNIAPDTGGMAYRIEQLDVDGCPVVAWESDPVNLSADDALAGDREEGGGRTERDDAAGWLRDLLAHGPKPAKDVERDAREAGYSIATVRRAKAAIGVVSRKPAFGGPWEWTLPAQDAQPPKMLTEDAHTPTSEHLGEKQAEIDGNPPKMLNGEGVSALGTGEPLGDTPTDAGDGWGEL